MPWSGASDDEIARMRKGDPDALAALIVRYQHRLYRYLLRLAKDPAAAEDLFQQTWLRVIERVRSIDAARNFDAWLFCLAHNLAVDDLRRRRPDDLDERIPATGRSSLELAMEGERARRVDAAVAQLPAVYRETLSLRFEEGMKLEEIAGVCRVPLSTVKSRLRRALEALREMVGDL